jgi:hypothetical protein
MSEINELRVKALEADKRELWEALDTLNLVIGLTPLAGNKPAMQEAVDMCREILKKHREPA